MIVDYEISLENVTVIPEYLSNVQALAGSVGMRYLVLCLALERPPGWSCLQNAASKELRNRYRSTTRLPDSI